MSAAILAISAIVFALLMLIREQPEKTAYVETAPLVITETVNLHSGELELETSGLVVPFREITMSAEVAGRITYKDPLCKAGTFVKAGTKLIEIDSEEYALQVERAQAELRQAEVQLEEHAEEVSGAQKLLDVAKKNEGIYQEELDRLEGLKGVVSTTELNQAERAVLTARNLVLAQANQLSLLEKREQRLISAKDLAAANLKTNELNLKRAAVTAPDDGVIARESVEKDDFVQRGTMLFEFEDTSAAEVKINLRPDELQWILDSEIAEPRSTDAKQNQDRGHSYNLPKLDATIEYAFEGGRAVWQGELSRYEGVGLDELTRTVPCRVLIKQRTDEASGRELLRGMYVTVKLHVKPKVRLLQVPATAVNAGNVVWTVKDDRLLRHRLNVVGIKAGDSKQQDLFVFLDSGDAPAIGEQVVVSPMVAPITGQPVRVGLASEVLPTADSGEPQEAKRGDLPSAGNLPAPILESSSIHTEYPATQ